MSKKIVRLTESDLREIVEESVKQTIIQINEEQLKTILSECVQRTIFEINHRDATAPMVINMNAQDEIKRGNDIEVLPDGTKLSFYDKRRNASSEIYARLTQGVVDNVGEHFHLQFGREEPDWTVSEVNFYFTEVILLTKNRVVLQGDVTMSRSDIPIGKRKPKTIQIDYKFNEQQFYEAVYCANNTVRDIRPLMLDYAGVDGSQNVETAKKLISFLTLCYYSVEDGRTDINNKPPIKGKPIIPFK